MSADQIERDSATTEVLCVGAGVAGLSAARDLSARGIRVTILEARDRIGGRIFTHRDADSAVPIELGAEFVHGRPLETLAIVGAARLMLCEVPQRHWQTRDGQLIRSGEFWAELDEIMQGMKRVKDRDPSFKQYLDTYCQKTTREAKSAAKMFIEGFHAAQIDKISVRSLNQENDAADQIDGDKQFRILNGYDCVADWLHREAASHGSRFHLKTIVNEVNWRKHHVEIAAKSGDGVKNYNARRLLVTLPLGVLQAPESVRFIPELDKKMSAAQSLAMGNVIKVVFRFREAFWEGIELPTRSGNTTLSDLAFIHATGESIPTWWTQLPVRTPILTSWTGGPEAEELCKRDDAYIIDSAMGSLERVLRISRQRIEDLLESAQMHNWKADPFTRGAYSYVTAGGLDAQTALGQPVEDTLFFAGEATNTEGHCGTVHGAIQSGERAAREVIASLGAD